jgi:N-formylglutamate deformylase
MTEILNILPAKGKRVPVIVSCPHVGTEIPIEIAREMDPSLVMNVPDTDWFVHELYGFAPEMGITLVHAGFSRYVVDLNRDPAGAKLYGDDRPETTLVPVQSFGGKPLYRNATPDDKEIARRKAQYFDPYHVGLAALLAGLRKEFKHVLFFDAHSIQRRVPSIRPEPFPDVIVGDQKGKTAAPALSQAALASLENSGLKVSYNDPFMGGYLTRSIGKPETGIHAIQLEMSQDIYMNEPAAQRDEKKQATVAGHLAALFDDLIDALGKLS